MNILIIGLGSIARKHITAIRELGINASFVALRSSPDTKDEEGIENIFGLDQLKCQPDLVIISNPTMLHYNALVPLIEKGYPLFIEKPLVGTLKQLALLESKLAQNPCFTYVACNLRFLPALAFVKNYLKNRLGEIQEVNSYCGSYLPEWRPGTNFRQNYSSREELGGGVHLDLIHEIDYCYWLFGKPDDLSLVKRHVSGLKINAVDFAAYHLLYPAFTANITLNYYRRDPKRVLEIVMSDCTIEVNLLKNSVTNITTGKMLFEQRYEIKQTYTDQMKYILHCLKEKQTPMNDVKEAANVLNIALA